MLEYWNVGMLELEDWGNGVMGYQIVGNGNFLKKVLIITYKHDKIPLIGELFHHSIIPGWNKKNGWRGIPSYQRFLEIPLHLIANY